MGRRRTILKLTSAHGRASTTPAELRVQPTEPRAVQLAGLEPGQSLVRERERPVRERRESLFQCGPGALLLHL